MYRQTLKLRILLLHPNQSPPIAKHNLSVLVLRRKPDLLKPINDLSSPPHLRRQLIARLHRRCKPRLELLEVLRVAAAERLQHAVRGRVPAVQPVDNHPAEAHLLSGLGCRVQRVVVAVQAISISKTRRIAGGTYR